MEIYGLGLVGACMILGSFLGMLSGRLLGLNTDVGGVGYAMVLMIFISNFLAKTGRPISEKTERGIFLLSSMYIPIVVAMSAKQDVLSALSGGLFTLVAGTVVTLGCLVLVPAISRLGRDKK